MSYQCLKNELQNCANLCNKSLSENHLSYVVDVLDKYDTFISNQFYCGICGISDSMLFIGDGINNKICFKFKKKIDSTIYFFKYFKLNKDTTKAEDLFETINDDSLSYLIIPVRFVENSLIFVFVKDRKDFEKHFNITDIKTFYDDFPVLTELLKWSVGKLKSNNEFVEAWNKDMVYSDNYPQDNYLLTQSIFKRLEYPYLNTINTLSGLCYENNENKGVIEFSEDFDYEVSNKLQIEFDKVDNFRFQDIRKVRKLLQISNTNFHLVLCSSHPFMYGPFSDDEYWLIKGYGVINPNNPLLTFLGNNKWIWESKNEIINFDGILYDFKSKHTCEEKGYEKKLNSYYLYLKNNCKITICDSIQNKIKQIISLANEQKFGTMLIFSEKAKDEAERLCKLKRGFLIKPINLFELLSEDEQKCKEILLQLTSIDGAVFLSEEGICYAIGVIVDGIANIDSDSSRGARFNSGKTYIRNCIDNEIRCFAVIISEDKTIDIIG